MARRSAVHRWIWTVCRKIDLEDYIKAELLFHEFFMSCKQKSNARAEKWQPVVPERVIQPFACQDRRNSDGRLLKKTQQDTFIIHLSIILISEKAGTGMFLPDIFYCYGNLRTVESPPGRLSSDSRVSAIRRPSGYENWQSIKTSENKYDIWHMRREQWTLGGGGITLFIHSSD